MNKPYLHSPAKKRMHLCCLLLIGILLLGGCAQEVPTITPPTVPAPTTPTTPTVPDDPKTPDDPAASITPPPANTADDTPVDPPKPGNSPDPSGNTDLGIGGPLEHYYDYLRTIPQVMLLFTEEDTPFSDDQLCAFALWTLASSRNYDSDVGYPKDMYQAVVRRHFSREIGNFNNSMTREIPETGFVTATGWSYNSSPHFVLKDILPGSGDILTAQFYYWNISDMYSAENLAGVSKNEIKGLLLKGDANWLPNNPAIVEITFEEMEDENGIYFSFHDTRVVELDYTGPFVPYS